MLFGSSKLIEQGLKVIVIFAVCQANLDTSLVMHVGKIKGALGPATRNVQRMTFWFVFASDGTE